MKKIEKVFSINGEDIKVTMGNFGFRADSALMLQKGETVVMTFVTVDTKDTDLDYFPLGVNYVEKYYAGGIISGSRFVKREKRPSDDAVIKGRVIDRGLRPLFPVSFKKAVSIVVNVLAYDGENDPALLAANAASLALSLSSIPFAGPLAFVRIGLTDEQVLDVNLKNGDLENSKLDAVIACSGDRVTQLEIAADQISDDVMKKAFELSVEKSVGWLDMIEKLKKEFGKKKLEYTEQKVDEELVEKYSKLYKKEIEKALFDEDNRNLLLDQIKNKAIEETDDENITKIEIVNALTQIEKKITRGYLLKGERLSGRKLDEIREIEIQAPFLPRVHGSAMFRRGITQALSITTLGSTRLVQINENFEGESEQRYMHHYVGPNYSFGDAGRFNFYAGNREIGHGVLAQKAILPVLPSEEDFPYAIRVVSEILSQNGSTSMAATCGSCLSLMDAGVPIKSPVAGISIGLITEDQSQKNFQLLTDVQDVEDFYGDMDFKVCGTKDGITAIQMDTKLKGVSVDILIKALDQAKEAKLDILDLYKKVLDAPREKLSKYAPRVQTLNIKTDQIGELIGPGGKVIKGILESVGNKAEVDIKDDGQVLITSVDEEAMNQVIEKIEAMFEEPEIGKLYKGKVAKIMNFGAFVDVSPSISGLVHISEIQDGFISDPNKVLEVGQEVVVKLVAIDSEGRLKLSIKQANAKKQSKTK